MSGIAERQPICTSAQGCTFPVAGTDEPLGDRLCARHLAQVAPEDPLATERRRIRQALSYLDFLNETRELGRYNHWRLRKLLGVPDEENRG